MNISNENIEVLSQVSVWQPGPRINVFSDTAQLKHFKFVDFFTDD